MQNFSIVVNGLWGRDPGQQHAEFFSRSFIKRGWLRFTLSVHVGFCVACRLHINVSHNTVFIYYIIIEPRLRYNGQRTHYKYLAALHAQVLAYDSRLIHLGWRLSPSNNKRRLLEVVSLSAPFKVLHQQHWRFGLGFVQRRGRFGIDFGFAAALLPRRPSPPWVAGRPTDWIGWSIVPEWSGVLTKGVTSTNVKLPLQSKRWHCRHCGRRRRKNSCLRPFLVLPPPPFLWIIFNFVVAPNFDGDCMSQRNFDILFAVTQGDGYATENCQRLILLIIRFVRLQQSQKWCSRCQ